MVFLIAIVPFASSFIQTDDPTGIRLRLSMFLAGEVLLGVPWGLFQGMTVPYISEITPMKLRGPATTLVSVFSTVGQLTSAVILRSTEELALGPEEVTATRERMDNWAFRLPMILQYTWILPLIIFFFLLPESPLNLLQRGQRRAALKTLRRLNNDPQHDAQGSLDALKAANRGGGGSGNGSGSSNVSAETGFKACFKRGNLRRTEITVMVYFTQQLVGLPLLFYAAKVLQNAGVTEGNSILVNMGMYFLCIVATFASIPVLRMSQRRTAWMGGLSGMIVCLVAIGIAGFYSANGIMGWVIAAFIIVLSIIFNLTLAPVGYGIASEVPTTRLKGATNSIARIALLVLVMVNMFLAPFLLGSRPEG